MSPINSTAVNPTASRLPLLNPHRPSSSNPLSPLSLKFPPRPLPHFSLPAIRASMPTPNPNRQNSDNSPKLFKLQTSNPLKIALATTVAAAALFVSGTFLSRKPAIATPISPPNVQTAERDSITDEEREKSTEEHLISNPDDVEALKSLMEIKIKSKKIPEAIEIIDRLVELEPEELEWPMMKSHLFAYNGEFPLARNGFNELVKKDPFCVEAYHGLVTVASQEESSQDLVAIERRVEEAITLCKKENKKTDLRDFKLLLAQIRVLEGKYDDALKLYQELVKEEPRDFRPYLCQGIIYTLLKKNGEAEKCFEKYRRLIPKGHPYASYFDDNMFATKLFAQKVENERAMANN
ncbi:hypothetical protein SASPL_102313 [Salvia splendens]|uniref:Protein SLOW GREEN 1, chloroplastic n=1 Tax=Salvia splendens TaxID=180675 RepID=A0A8X9ACQ9_SALSN|nr:protein SLOW GREEN 1, chloroplastic-like [Salvia splendens]KAG6437397.1 hypothetical protein SASPL_102313 [Salvia splendens]